MSEYDSSDLSRRRRAAAPDWWGEECPVCGDPFDAGSSGWLWADEETATEVFSWVRLCTAPEPGGEFLAIPDEEDVGVFAFVHKDEHLEDSR